MTKQPTYRPTKSPEQRAFIEKRKALLKAFLTKYPTPFVAWVERQRSQSVREFWRAMMDPMLPPEIKVLIGHGLEIRPPMKSQRLWDCWFRAAVTMMIKSKRDRVEGDLTVLDLVEAFGIERTRYQALVDAETAWVKRSRLEAPKLMKEGLMASQPGVEDIFVRLLHIK